MTRYAIGAVLGGVVGYWGLYRWIGCSSGACPITANPYTATLYGILLGLLFAGSNALSGVTGALKGDASTATYQKITAEEAKSRIDSGGEFVVLDVRTKAEYEAGHIPGAVLLPNESISRQALGKLPDPEAEILVYCRSGNRSARAAKKLIKLGYTNVYDFGGIIDWPYETVKQP